MILSLVDKTETETIYNWNFKVKHETENATETE